MQQWGAGRVISTVTDSPLATLLGSVAGTAFGSIFDGLLGTPGLFSGAFGSAGGETIKQGGAYLRRLAEADGLCQNSVHMERCLRARACSAGGSSRLGSQ